MTYQNTSQLSTREISIASEISTHMTWNIDTTVVLWTDYNMRRTFSECLVDFLERDFYGRDPAAENYSKKS